MTVLQKLKNVALFNHPHGVKAAHHHVPKLALFKPGKVSSNTIFRNKPCCHVIRNDRQRPGPFMPKGY